MYYVSGHWRNHFRSRGRPAAEFDYVLMNPRQFVTSIVIFATTTSCTVAPNTYSSTTCRYAVAPTLWWQ